MGSLPLLHLDSLNHPGLSPDRGPATYSLRVPRVCQDGEPEDHTCSPIETQHIVHIKAKLQWVLHGAQRGGSPGRRGDMQLPAPGTKEKQSLR